jgi:hypothetical protein
MILSIAIKIRGLNYQKLVNVIGVSVRAKDFGDPAPGN